MNAIEQMQRDTAMSCLEYWINSAADAMACLDKYSAGYAQTEIASAKGVLSAMRWTMLLDHDLLIFWDDVLTEWRSRAIRVEFGVRYVA